MGYVSQILSPTKLAEFLWWDDNYENGSGCCKLIVTIETSSKVNKMSDDFSVPQRCGYCMLAV